MSTQQLLPLVAAPHLQFSGGMAISPDGQELASGTLGGVAIVSTTDGTLLREIKTELTAKVCRDLEFTDDSVIAVYHDRVLRLDRKTGKASAARRFPEENNLNVLRCPSPHGLLLVTHKQLHLLSGKALTTRRTYSATRGSFHTVAFSVSGRHLAAAYGDGSIELLHWPETKPFTRLQGHQSGVTWLQFLEDDRTLLSSSFDGTIRFWDVASGRELGVLQHPQQCAVCAHVCESTRRLLGLSTECDLHVWSALSGHE